MLNEQDLGQGSEGLIGADLIGSVLDQIRPSNRMMGSRGTGGVGRHLPSQPQSLAEVIGGAAPSLSEPALVLRDRVAEIEATQFEISGDPP
jgi:hypothetical protein